MALAKFHRTLVFLAIIDIGLMGCAPDTPNAIERDQKGEEAIIRPKYLSAEQALTLSERLKLRGTSTDVIGVLRFTHYYKLGQKEPALVALERVNNKLAMAVVASAKERRTLESQSVDLDVEEGFELRRELESSTECEQEVASGRFVPLTGKEFCLAWDSGVLDLLPSPAKLLTRAARVAAARSLSKLPRERLKRFPRPAAIMTRYATKRILREQDVAAHIQREEQLTTQLMDLTWNVATGLSSPD
jgi:hypothetical protein